MRARILAIVCLGAVFALGACSGDEGQDCGEGTVASGDQCVPADEAVVCGEGTSLQGGECVSDVVATDCGDGTTLVDGVCVADEVGGPECGAGTVDVDGECVVEHPLNCAEGTTEVDGECVADAACGPDTELVDGACVSTVGCGEGTIEIDGNCELIDPFDGIEREADEPNDPAFFGDAANVSTVTLGAEGETVLVTGNIDPPTTIMDEEENSFLAADFDVVFFEGTKGTRVGLEATAIGAPGVAVAIVFIAEDDDDRNYVRIAFPFGSKNAWREAVLPYDGTYMLRVGTPTDTATFFNFVTEGNLNFGGLVGEPEGADDFTWILGLTHIAPTSPETFVGNATFMFTGDDVRSAPQALVEAEAGTIVQLGLEPGPGVLGTFTTHDADYTNVAQDAGIVIVPEGGLHITVDSFAERSNDPSFNLTVVQLVQIPQGELAAGSETEVTGTLVANTTQFISFSVAAPSVVSFAGGPAPDADTNIGMYLSTGDLTETFAGSFDQLFGLPSATESFSAFVQPGDYQLIILHEELDEENGSHDFVVDITVQAVTDAGSLAAGGEVTATVTTLGPEGASAYYSTTTDTLGILTATATPDENLDVALRVHNGPFLTARDAVIAIVDANDGLEGEVEAGGQPHAPGVALVGLFNSGLTADEPNGLALALTLEAIATEEEPNDTPGTGNAVAFEDGTLVGGTLAVDVDTTADWYTFDVVGIAEASFAVNPVGENPAAGLRMSLFAEGNTTDAIATAETFVDFFSGQAVEPAFDVVLEEGAYRLLIEQINDEATGDYLLVVNVGDVLDCVPGRASCEGDDLVVCVDGFDMDVTTCEGACVEVGGTFGCDLIGETEPNDDTDTAQDASALRSEIIGDFRDGDDADYYEIVLEGAARVTANTSFSVAPGADTTISLRDSDDAEIAFNDDTPPGLFSLVQETLDAGTYYVVVESFGQFTGNYRLTINIEPAQCEGDEVACGEGGVVACDGFEFVLSEECGFGCEVGDDGPFCTVPEFIPEVEPNGDPTIQGIDVVEMLPFTGQGTIAEPGDDQDFYGFTAVRGGVYTMGTAPFGESPVSDTKIALCGIEHVFSDEGCTIGSGFSPGNNIAENDDFNGLYSYIETELEPGFYFVLVESFGSGTGDYLVTIDLAPAPGEPNNSFADATEFALNTPYEFSIDENGDRDFYVYEVTQDFLDANNGSVELTFHTLSQGEDAETMDSVLLLCTSDQACDANENLARNDDGGPDAGDFYSQIVYTFDTPGFYYLVVEELGNNGTGDYVLFSPFD